MSEWVIEARGLTRRFGDFTAVDDLDLRIPKQSIYGFLGPNGCGKSTTMRMLTGLLTPSAGEARVLGLKVPREAEALRLRFGYMTQKFSLYEDLSVEENLKFMAQIYSLPVRTVAPRIAQQLSTFGLDQRHKQMAGSLSGGQRQRLALAAATLHQPELLFLDEPTSAVDPENRRDFWEILFDLCDQGATILVSTHYMDEAERCHRLAIMEAGIKRADGTPQQLMADMGAHVLEIDGEHLRVVKESVLSLPHVLSAAQQGTYLRVLVDECIADAPLWLKQQRQALLSTRGVRQVRPSLEDVFVQCTGEGRQ